MTSAKSFQVLVEDEIRVRSLRPLFQTFFSHLKYRNRFVWLFIAAAADGAASFAIPIVLAEFAGGNRLSADVGSVSAVVAGLFILSLVLQWLLRRYGESLAGICGLDSRKEYFKKLAALPVPVLQREHSGMFLSYIGTVSDGMGGLINESHWGLAKSITVMALFFYFTARESLVLAVVNGIILVAFVVLSASLSWKMIPLAEATNASRARYLERFTDFLANISTVRKLGVSDYALQQISERQGAAVSDINRVQLFHANRWFLLHALFGVAFIGTVLALTWQISANNLSPAPLILFVAAYGTLRGLVERLSENVKTLFHLSGYLAQLQSAIPETKDVHSHRTDDLVSLSMKDIRFTFEKTEQQVSIPEFDLRQGEIAVITGPSGQGKSTFLNLLAGLYLPTEGEYLINGENADQFSPEWFGKHFAFVSQEIELFNLTLRENILLGREEPQEFLEMLDSLQLTGWVSSLPDGLETVVGEKGVRLSAGQKQRVNLLRGIVQNREVVLLDEPTSHLDSETEAAVVRYLEKQLAGRTAVIVTHRSSLRSLADNCYQFRHNRLVRE